MAEATSVAVEIVKRKPIALALFGFEDRPARVSVDGNAGSISALIMVRETCLCGTEQLPW